MTNLTLIEITPDNVEQETLFCIKDLKNPAFKCKQTWFEKRYAEGLRMIAAKNESGKLLAFIEYLPATHAWRPIHAPKFMFIHCMYVYANKDKQQGLGSSLIKACEADAKARGLAGVCVMTSKGSWITDKRIFEKNDYIKQESKGRFELMVKAWDRADAHLIDWTKQLDKYKGWHLLYADQCPWHLKAVEVIKKVAKDKGICLKVKRLESRAEIESIPSGFGTFALVRDGKLLSDHYISETRFHNILKKELECEF
ncbi:GNAT family N-acetyltransferase [Carboxylicivirga sp. N1Y90]|uniref:GNAT family N-acetyltransferase n=1 Tax=Carboxylicivirga fragile TaxID=3417571 RepID=UPI003D34DADB|nr:GNAT family N-acetyltransferase [Marinilabiliaceae bacterium N1Y90]